VAKLAANEKLRAYVQDRLAGTITRPDGTEVPGPSVRWAGRRHGPRQDHRWAKSWSPERISKRLVVDFPDDESMRSLIRRYTRHSLSRAEGRYAASWSPSRSRSAGVRPAVIHTKTAARAGGLIAREAKR